MNTRKLVGHRIKQARERLGITQEELAFRMGSKSQNAISAYEKGKRAIRLTELPELASVLGVPISYFFADIENEPYLIDLLQQFPEDKRKEILERLEFELELLRR